MIDLKCCLCFYKFAFGTINLIVWKYLVGYDTERQKILTLLDSRATQQKHTY